jgi:hypothetical protein
MTDYATLLRDHVTLKVRSIDRIFLQAYVPYLQTVGLVCRFLRWQRHFRILCEADAQPAPDVATFCHVTQPSTTEDGLYASALRFGEPRVMAVLGALVGFVYLVAGFANRQLVEWVAALLHAPYGCRQTTYDLRRLKRKRVD